MATYSRLIVKILHFAQYDRKKVMKTDKKEEAAFAKAVQAVAAHCEATDCGHCPYYRTHWISENKESICKLNNYPYKWGGNNDGE